MLSQRDKIEDLIERTIRESFRVSDADPAFSRDARLLDEGYVDFPGVIELIVNLESTFDIELSDDQVFGEGFATIRDIGGVVTTAMLEKLAALRSGNSDAAAEHDKSTREPTGAVWGA